MSVLIKANKVNSVGLKLCNARWTRTFKYNTQGLDVLKTGQTNLGDLQPISRLIEAYTQNGHKIANVNPLSYADDCKRSLDDLNPNKYGVDIEDNINTPEIQCTVEELIQHLENTYCGRISLESSHVESEQERLWLSDTLMQQTQTEVDGVQKIKMCKQLIESQNLDNFIATKFGSVKRYGGEGAETLLTFTGEAMDVATADSCEHIIMAMPHRGRNNLLHGQLQMPAEVLFGKMRGHAEFPKEALSISTCDVLSHLTSSTDIETVHGKLHVTMVPNPSHLEAANSVAIGKSRARLQTLFPEDYKKNNIDEISSKVMSLIMHGDAAIMGQGLVAEGFNMAQLNKFDVGGTLHLIVNNQLGFTATANVGRSSRYCSDVGKIIGCPVLHVNGDFPEDVARAARIAVLYRQQFKKDIIVDLICYRRWGHNELDDPSFTQPLMYQEINERLSVPDNYAAQLIDSGEISQEEVNDWKRNHTENLNKSLKNIDNYFANLKPIYLSPSSPWGEMKIPNTKVNTHWDTGYDIESLKFIGQKSVEIPEEFTMHPRLVKFHTNSRINKLIDGNSVDWATAEALSLGSLLDQGFNVRVCGQDVGRGTFSHRHALITCQDSEEIHVPLNHIKEDQSSLLEMVNSPLSEEAVLAFEYGMSIEHPSRLVIWEAQFGDFFNPAQVIIDAFITSGEAKWMQQSGLVMLLPHGYDGAGPEHSSCRMERFLQLTNSEEHVPDSDAVNFSVCNPSTPAQYFHLLRRQMVRDFRKPLVVVAPKTLLRLPAAVSSLPDMASGTKFQPIIDDPNIIEKSKVKSVIFCSGRHYYTLADARAKLQKDGTVAIVRLEELCPFPTKMIRDVISSYDNASSYTWSQEEPRNMGAWSFVNPRFMEQCGQKLKYAGRETSAAPAVAIKSVHEDQIKLLLNESFK